MSDFQCCLWNDLEADYDEATGKEGPTLMASGCRSVVIEAYDASTAAEQFALGSEWEWNNGARVVVEHEDGKREVFEVHLSATAHRAGGCVIEPRVGPKRWP